MEKNLDSPIASSDAEAATSGLQAAGNTLEAGGPAAGADGGLPPGPVVKRESRGGLWLVLALLIVAVLIFLAKNMI